MSYSRAGTEAVPLKVMRDGRSLDADIFGDGDAVGKFTEMVRLS